MQTLNDEQYLEKDFDFSKAVKNPYVETIPSKINCVYKFTDANDEVIYVGKCKNLKARFNSHKYEPHLDKQCYSEVRKVQYISYPTYMDAGVMERIFIAHYQPKYNVQFVKEGVQSIVSPEQLDSVEWSLLADYPNGFPLNENKRRRMGVLDRADFCLYDGEGVVGEAYFYKIIKQNHKPKALKIVGCLVKLDESAFSISGDDEWLEEEMQKQREKCNNFTDYPMRFMREDDLNAKLDTFRYEQNMPFVYKGCGARLYYGDEDSPMRFTYIDDCNDNGKTITTLAWATALELMARNGEIDEMDYPAFLP